MIQTKNRHTERALKRRKLYYKVSLNYENPITINKPQIFFGTMCEGRPVINVCDVGVDLPLKPLQSAKIRVSTGGSDFVTVRVDDGSTDGYMIINEVDELVDEATQPMRATISSSPQVKAMVWLIVVLVTVRMN